MLAELLDQAPFNLAIADLYKTRFNGVPGVVYAAGVRHAYNVAEAFRAIGHQGARRVSGETPKRELAEILARYERGEIDVLVNAQLLAEGWNSPRATVCMHLAPTASKRIYQQRVGRVTRRHPGKEAGVVVDFVHPATKHDDPVVTLHSLLDRDVYRGGAIVVGPVRRGRGRRVRVERRVIPVAATEDRRHEVFERELWRIAVEHLDWGEQHMWAALAGARVQPSGWRRARAMLHFDRTGELKRRFLLTAVERNKNSQLRLRALQEIAALKRPRGVRPRRATSSARWSRDERREGVEGPAAGARREAHRPPRPGERLDLAPGRVHARGARGVRGAALAGDQAAARPARQLLRRTRTRATPAGSCRPRASRTGGCRRRCSPRRVAHTPEAEEVLRGARTRLARKPGALSRELLRNFPKGKGRRGRRRKRKGAGGGAARPARPARARGEGAARRRRRRQANGTDANAAEPIRRARRRRRAAGRRRAVSCGRAAERLAAGGPRRPRARSGRRRRAPRRSRPSPSMPAATPVPPAQRDRAARAARPARGRPPAAPRRRARARRSSSRSRRLAHGGDVAPGAEPERRRGRVQLRRQVGDVAAPRSARCRAPPSPPAAGPRRGCPATLRSSSSTSFGHLIRAPAPQTRATATPARERQQVGRVAQDERSSAARCPAGADQAAALAPAARRSARRR